MPRHHGIMMTALRTLPFSPCGEGAGRQGGGGRFSSSPQSPPARNGSRAQAAPMLGAIAPSAA